MISVLLADDQELVRRGFAALIDAEDDLKVVGHATTGVEAVEGVRANHPDVVLMDVRMPELDGIAATRMIAEDPALAPSRVLMLTTFDLDEYIYDALRAGASGFLLKDTEPGQLLDAIRILAAGDALLAPSITRRLIADFAAGGPKRSKDGSGEQALDQLTDRELEVLTSVGQGLTNREIAEQLFISPLTAKTHVSRILAKLNARDRVQLVVVAYETGLVTPAT